MKGTKSATLFIITFFIVLSSHAQSHYNSWFRGTLSYPFSEKWILDQEVQHRRQNNYNNQNLLDKNLLNSYRIWIHHQWSPHIKFSVSPLAYFQHYNIINSAVTNLQGHHEEWRFSAALEFKQNLLPNLSIYNRTATEYRIQSQLEQHIVRWRTRTGLSYQIDNNFNISISEEILLNLNNTKNSHLFDHNRLGVNIVYRLNKQIKLDLGYIKIHRLPRQSDIIIPENNFIMNITYLI